MITLVISSYGYGHLAAHCIESALSQSIKPEKIIFVDDGFGDCGKLPTLYPEIEYLFRKKNLGIVANFQEMLERVETEFCLFVGADNWLRSDAIESFYKVINSDKVDVITYDMVLTGELKEQRLRVHGEECQPYQGDFHWSRKLLHHGSMVYRRELALKVGGYASYKQVSENSLEDLDLFTRMVDAGAKITHVDQPLLYYRQHRNNFNKYEGSRQTKSSDKNLRTVITKLFNRIFDIT